MARGEGREWEEGWEEGANGTELKEGTNEWS
eukprot:CAMPEP_0184676946 /NCGR_PEP_ID=MMETSP0308-20130426/88625_1 /TAXON_ID=38269 /ORGANISM="Gloeochaete witrockiana, Strain SAG 46.84" /LENGTH=30 /DNA_ID= /DNA_START= /DNA_END= /DNA_ORIENTATION=